MEPNENHEEKEQNCYVCHVNGWKYTCPSCGTKTCSLNCFKRHKLQMSCTGKSDVTLNRTRYASKDQITGLSVQRDYNFLMKMDRNLKVSQEDLEDNSIIKAQKRSNKSQSDWRWNKRRALQHFVLTDSRNKINRNGIEIKRQPIGMARQKLNKSYLDRRTNNMLWTIEWILIDDLMKHMDKTVTYRNNDSIILSEILPHAWIEKRNLNSNKNTQYLNHDVNKTSEQDHSVQKLFCFVNPLDQRTALIEISTYKSIRDSLSGMQFVEFPTIYICKSENIKPDKLELRKLKVQDTEVESQKPRNMDVELKLNSLDRYTSESSSSDSEPPEESSARVKSGKRNSISKSNAGSPNLDNGNTGRKLDSDTLDKESQTHKHIVGNIVNAREGSKRTCKEASNKKEQIDLELSGKKEKHEEEKDDEDEDDEDTNYRPPETM